MRPKSIDSKSSERPADTKAADDIREEVLFSRLIDIEHVADAGSNFSIEADAEECAALASRYQLVVISRLKAAFHVVARPGKRFNVSGRVTASITQTCVVSLEPFDSEIAEEVDVDFAAVEDAGAVARAKSEFAKPKLDKFKAARLKDENTLSSDYGKLEEDEADPPDPIRDGKIDLGALASEFLALALDPYPRKPGVQFDEVLIGAVEDEASPFAILRKLDKTP